MHPLQLLPLAAWALHEFGPPLAERAADRLMVVVSVGYAGVVVLLAWQAMRGLPVLGPDAVIGTAGLVWAGLVLGAGALVVRRGQVPA